MVGTLIMPPVHLSSAAGRWPVSLPSVYVKYCRCTPCLRPLVKFHSCVRHDVFAVTRRSRFEDDCDIKAFDDFDHGHVGNRTKQFEAKPAEPDGMGHM